MNSVKPITLLGMALAINLSLLAPLGEGATCLGIELSRNGGTIGFWVNRCSVGVNVLWHNSKGTACRSRPGKKYACASYVPPNGRSTAPLVGRIEWAECKSPGGSQGVHAWERPDGSVYCDDRIPVREWSN